MEFNYSKCPECGYVNQNQPDVCPSCGFDWKAYRDELQAKENAERARVAELAAELANRAYSFISETMDGATQGEDENKDYLFSFIAAFFDGSNIATFESETQRISLLLSSLYRYYDTNKDKNNDRYYSGQQKDAIIDTYNSAINLMGRYLSSSKNNRLKSTVGCLTPSKSIEFYFNFIITELDFELSGQSPFSKMLNLENSVSIFVGGFLEDDELSKNEELKSTIEQYIAYLHDTYEKHGRFSNFTMENCMEVEEDEDDDVYPEYLLEECPHCQATIKKTLRHKYGEEHKIKCAVCGKSWISYPDDHCPECGCSNFGYLPYGVNSMTCSHCGLKYDLVLTDPDDDEGATVSIRHQHRHILPCGDACASSPEIALQEAADQDSQTTKTLTPKTTFKKIVVDDKLFMTFLSESDTLVTVTFFINEDEQYKYDVDGWTEEYDLDRPTEFLLSGESDQFFLFPYQEYEDTVLGWCYSSARFTVNGIAPARETFSFSVHGKTYSVDFWTIEEHEEGYDVDIEYIPNE